MGDFTVFALRKITFRCKFVPSGDSEYSYATNVVNRHVEVRSYASSAASWITCHTGPAASVHRVVSWQKSARTGGSPPTPSPRKEPTGGRYWAHVVVSYAGDPGVVQRLTSPRYSA